MNRILRICTSLLTTGIAINANSFWWPAAAQIAGNAAGCPVGTRESPTTLVTNGNFATNAGTGLGVPIPRQPVANFPALAFNNFPLTVPNTRLPYRGDAVYPSDGGPPTFDGGGISVQDDRFNNGQIPNAPVGVVAGRGVNVDEAVRAGLEPVRIPTYLYSNPNLDENGQPVVNVPAGTPAPIIWSQRVPIAQTTVYNFKALFFNLLTLQDGGLDPRIRLRGVTSTGRVIEAPNAIVVGPGPGRPTAPLPGFPDIPNVRQAWLPIQVSFTTQPGETSIDLLIVDETQDIFGDDFGVTAINLRECIPNLGAAKQAGTPVANPNGTFTIPYTVRVRNLAPAVGTPDPYALNRLQVLEDLSQTFANATIVSVTGIQSPTLVVNPAFNGTTDTRLLQPNANILNASVEATITFNVTIRPGTGPGGNGPFTNVAIAEGFTDSGIRVSDLSTNGTNVDPDGDGDPNEGGENGGTVITVPPGGGGDGGGAGLPANVVLVKRITNVTRNGAPLPGVNFGVFVDDPATTTDNDPGWAQLIPPGSPIGVPSLSNNTPLQSGDEIEYTVYFLSNGQGPAPETSICDPIPVGTTLIPLSNQVRVGNTAPGSGGTVFTPLAPLPANNSCPDQTNPNGAVIFELGDVSNIPTNNLGFVRFRVRIN
ncbi:MAG: hypothetical protein NW220_08905 [Leptolyngbyaceae cyanobacterium bins.349]|nr:hypothetical protein [Leptolyngbyaceae cyanobacterium bins.349]